MSGWLSLFLICIAVSLDGLAVGLTYGLRKLRIPVRSLLIILCCTFGIVYGIMTVGRTLFSWLNPEEAKLIGSGVLVLIGSITLWRMWISKNVPQDMGEADREKGSQPISQIRAFGLIFQILRDPARADADHSGHIAGWEAVMLGMALSLDAFGAGISLSLLGYPPFLVSSCLSVTSITLLLAGFGIGWKADKKGWFARFKWLPPILLICIGLARWVG
ncbi:sporulation membrane protein YtaF [Brevibacillus migulae]|uniref:sporulation membrane protein YtaF n=1 Tax=Brevibacillus migulae TaxID=1644114 RepID=UPI00106E31D1|nr:sporulation membrane protein YtaF [Brevibacillus migulae]